LPSFCVFIFILFSFCFSFFVFALNVLYILILTSVLRKVIIKKKIYLYEMNHPVKTIRRSTSSQHNRPEFDIIIPIGVFCY
jgi:predicted membrane protein